MAKFDLNLPEQFDREKKQAESKPVQTRNAFGNIGRGLRDGAKIGAANIAVHATATSESLYNKFSGDTSLN